MPQITQGEADATWAQLGSVPREQLEQGIARTNELGATAFKAKDFTKAYEYYNTVVTGTEYLQQTGPTPEDATYVVNALANRSACKLGMKDAAGARADASECCRLRPKWQKGWFRFGRALYDEGNFPAAEAAFSRLVDLEPTSGWARTALGLTLDRQSRHREGAAQHRIAEALGASPRDHSRVELVDRPII